MKSNVSAYWTIALEVICPECESLFDLTMDPDFWKNSGCETGEHDTPRTRDVLVTCHDCEHEFKVDFVH